MENLEAESPFRVMGCLGTVIAALLVLGFVAASCEGVERAKADREWARVAAIEANAARDRETNLHREQMFMLWSAALASHDGWLVVVSVVLGVVSAVAIARWLDRREVF